jgi:hypothetical protein
MATQQIIEQQVAQQLAACPLCNWLNARSRGMHAQDGEDPGPR